MKGALPPHKGKHLAAITEPVQIGKLMRDIDGYAGTFIVRCAFKLSPLVFLRPIELSRAEWAEIDLDKAEWRIPADKMKMKALHIIPLPTQAVAILREVYQLTGTGKYVFPSVSSSTKSMAKNTILAALRSMGYTSTQMTAHGFRHMASTLLTTSWDGLLRLYRFDGHHLTLLEKRAVPGGKQPYAARFSPDGKRIAVGFNDTAAVNVLDGGNLALRFAPDTIGVRSALANIAWSRDGTVLFAASLIHSSDGQHHIRRWADGGTGIASNWLVARDLITCLVSLPDGRLAFGSADPAWGVVDTAGQQVLFHASATADLRGSFENFKLSSNGAQVRFGYEILGQSPAVFDILHRIFLPVDSSNLAAPRLSAPGVTLTDWKDTTTPKLNGAPLKKLNPHETSRSLALWADGKSFALGTDWGLLAYASSGTPHWQRGVPGTALVPCNIIAFVL